MQSTHCKVSVVEPTSSYPTTPILPFILPSAPSKFDKKRPLSQTFSWEISKIVRTAVFQNFLGWLLLELLLKRYFSSFLRNCFYNNFRCCFFLHKTSDEEKAAESFIEHDNEPTETPLQRMGHRKKLTYMLNVHSIDTSLAKDN